MHTFGIIILIIMFIALVFLAISYGMIIDSENTKAGTHIGITILILIFIVTAIVSSKALFQEQVKTKKEPVIETIITTKENKADTTYIYHFE